MATDEGARTHHCVRLFCIIDTLTITSVLPGIDDIIDEYPTGIARTGHAHVRNMSGFGIPLGSGAWACDLTGGPFA